MSEPDDLHVASICSYFLDKNGDNVCPRGEKHRKQVINKFIKDRGHLLVRDLKPQHLDLWVRDQPTLKSNWTRSSWMAAVKRCFQWAVEMGCITHNPFRGVKRERGERGRPLTDREFQALIRHAEDNYFRRYLMFLKYTGCRPGEAAEMTWDEVDLSRCVVTLKEHKLRRKSGELRRIRFNDTPAEGLLRWLKKRAGTGNPLVFTNSAGGPWLNSVRSARITRIRKLAGIPNDAKIYGLRHAYGTEAVKANVPIKAVAGLMGHSSVAATEYYVHLADSDAWLSQHTGDVFKKKPKPR